METVSQQYTVYTIDELSEQAKQKAYEKWQEHELDYSWYEFVFEDVTRTAEIIGIRIDRIYFSGFYSQGDGACFEGAYKYNPGWKKEFIREYGKNNESIEEPLRIAEALQKVQRKVFYKAGAEIKHKGHYYHELCTDIDVHINDVFIYAEYNKFNQQAEDQIVDLLRDYMRYIYKRLEQEHDYLLSMDSFIESCESNEYRFTEDGTLFY